MQEFVIQELEKKDLPKMLEMVRELAIYEEMEDVLSASKQDYEENLFENKFAKALLLTYKGEAVGYAIYFYTFSSFLGHGGLYLEDLYIRENFRKKGFAKAVFRYLAQICKEKKLKRLEWVCLHSNDLGIGFYERLNAENMSKIWRTYRLDGENLDILSKE
ncbi:N-acetyltransferase [Campylobacter sp. MIT 99-7217]|uniref:GNAT family N-acetyltransferase n=1 Tax=Campylobacter sp. MIT 99-7217 TaxID=535091 RepID=UPI00115A6C73|nr:GNAT family N-acetyltransferase [Campylobacter sp. MIT 99-7217]TQR34677.1 N-acetyltransferase [Campylobacter sp. MIT 99-7217]